ncbi:unnamed protein product [Soboliphyme baturini]|uniref:Peptidyl-prolyl cis-trans isomerase n=1 Tax=Soboliphyme baturini TaxID=241478 RepID=A0A183IK10_9BILA|nr:unnamed protein product [Soboliphyme baturini]
MSVLFETTVGDMVVDLHVKERPRSCLNFLKLCKLKFYNFSLFHSIEQNFIAQTGDPTETGRGGDSIFRILYGDQACFFEKETIPPLKHTKIGTVSMVNNGQDLHASQVQTARQVRGVCQMVFSHMGFLTASLQLNLNCRREKDKEANLSVVFQGIMHTIILDDPFEDPVGLRIPSRSPSPTERLLKSSRIAVDEVTDETDGKSEDVLIEEIEAKEAKARAHILEMVGDLHHAEERPPDNVLFVCKLNPVTAEDDLEIIFSRFGTILSCEVIRDKKTGNSLQYAFIEFETPQQCESAYFKMDNVLIDDRRIHVDFSQSVAKNFQWKRQGTPQIQSRGH